MSINCACNETPRSRMMQNMWDARIEQEAILAGELQKEFPEMSRGDALMEAARLINNEKQEGRRFTP